MAEDYNTIIEKLAEKKAEFITKNMKNPNYVELNKQQAMELINHYLISCSKVVDLETIMGMKVLLSNKIRNANDIKLYRITIID